MLEFYILKYIMCMGADRTYKKGALLMRFRTTDTMFFKQGTEKAYAVHDGLGKTHYIPKSQVTLVETIPPTNEYDIEHHIVEIPDWLCRRLPIFSLQEIVLDR